MSTTHSETAIIRIHCPDQRGIVARVTDFIHRNNGNIVALDQHTDRDEGRFFMRIEWELHGFGLEKDQIEPAFQFAIATPCKMQWKLHFSVANTNQQRDQKSCKQSKFKRHFIFSQTKHQS